MALILLQAGVQPLGQFDGYTGETLNFKGGEVCTWGTMPWPVTSSADVNDGYLNPTGLGKLVPGVTKSSTFLTATVKPLFLADEGTLHYGTLFGTVVGGSVGSVSFGPNSSIPSADLLGPNTATGSGKITLWDKPGLYAVTLDAVDTTNLVPTNGALTVGSALSYTSAGLLTPVANSVGGSATVVARLAEFSTNGSYVTTPNSLVAALNSPSGDVSSLQTLAFTQVVFWYAGAQGGA
jgi:hypothetical protein